MSRLALRVLPVTIRKLGWLEITCGDLREWTRDRRQALELDLAYLRFPDLRPGCRLCGEDGQLYRIVRAPFLDGFLNRIFVEARLLGPGHEERRFFTCAQADRMLIDEDPGEHMKIDLCIPDRVWLGPFSQSLVELARATPPHAQVGSRALDHHRALRRPLAVALARVPRA